MKYLVMTWNVEGFARNVFNFKELLYLHKPDLVFLSETQIYQCDIDHSMRYLEGLYSFSLNSDNLYEPDLPLQRSKAYGGTMVMWKKELHPYVTVHPPISSAILPIIFQPPSCRPTIHISVYLPTNGRESQFLTEISNLSTQIHELKNKYPDHAIYIRGDFNVSKKNVKRTNLLEFIKDTHDLIEVELQHPTYHHFTGNGASDSHLDRILYSRECAKGEELLGILCKFGIPYVSSSHDVILSSTFALTEETPRIDLKTSAPKVRNDRHRVLWSDEGIQAYQELIVPHLQRLQDQWLSSISPSCMSMLLSSTNFLLSSCSKFTNKTISLSQPKQQKSCSTPKQVRRSAKNLLKLSRRLRNLKSKYSATSSVVQEFMNIYKVERSRHRKLCRTFKAKEAAERDALLLKNPTATYSLIRRSKRNQSSKLHKLVVDQETFVGENVPDGFFTAIKQLKERNDAALADSLDFQEFQQDYENILKLCKESTPIKPITELESLEILKQMKPNVCDLYSITPAHYLNAGPAGCRHFFLLLSKLINDISTTSIDEINSAYACVLFKGHKKDRSLAKSYRTISTCPVVAKGLDMYVRNLYVSRWNACQAETQFQGDGSSHELAALLLTECVEYSRITLKQPAYVLYLDAAAAFDVVLKELLIKSLYSTQEADQSLLYLNNRLSNRQTYVDWNGTLMGPINDGQGLEQGGTNSSDYYKIFAREQLELAQRSKLGIPLGDLTVSAIGQADDTVLVSNNIHHLFYLLHLTLTFCTKHQIKISAEKTSLQVFNPKGKNAGVDIDLQPFNPIKIDGKTIPFSSSAEHVGILRSTVNNQPTILAHFDAHKRAVAAILQTGMARAHRGNPAFGLQVYQLYGIPVLLSGLAPLLLTTNDIEMIDSHHRDMLRRIMRLHSKTPRSVIYFLSGSLPGSALIHMRQLSLFGMISRLSDNILRHHALNIFQCHTYTKSSWFHQIRNWCLLYALPHPISILQSPPPKEVFKQLVKKKVISYWEVRLREESCLLSSLTYFRPDYMSLCKPHPLWRTAGSSPAKVTKATVQALLLSGRYRTEGLMKHWSSNKSGFCLLSRKCNNSVEDIPHFLATCPALDKRRNELLCYTAEFASTLPDVVSETLLLLCCPTAPLFIQFILDCSTIPSVIKLSQEFMQFDILESFFEVSRTWPYALHRERLKLLNRWKS